MTIFVLKIVVRQEHLGDLKVVFSKQFGVRRHQGRLANGGASLQVGKVGRALGHVQDAHAGADGSGGYDDHLPAGLALGSHLANQLLNLPGINLFAAVGQDTCAKLDHHAACFCQRITLHQTRLGLKATGPLSKQTNWPSAWPSARKVARRG